MSWPSRWTSYSAASIGRGPTRASGFSRVTVNARFAARFDGTWKYDGSVIGGKGDQLDEEQAIVHCSDKLADAQFLCSLDRCDVGHFIKRHYGERLRAKSAARSLAHHAGDGYAGVCHSGVFSYWTDGAWSPCAQRHAADEAERRGGARGESITERERRDRPGTAWFGAGGAGRVCRRHCSKRWRPHLWRTSPRCASISDRKPLA